MRELFLVITVMGAGYVFVQTTHRIVGRFLEAPGLPDVTLDMPIDLASDARGLTRAEILSNARKCGLELNAKRLSPVEQDWHSCFSDSEDEHLAIARFIRNVASVSGKEWFPQGAHAVR